MQVCGFLNNSDLTYLSNLPPKTCMHVFLVGCTHFMLESIFRNCCQSLWHIPLKILMVANFNSLRVEFHFVVTCRQVEKIWLMFFWSPN